MSLGGSGSGGGKGDPIPPRGTLDKYTDPNWKPTRGGKKARQQADLAARVARGEYFPPRFAKSSSLEPTVQQLTADDSIDSGVLVSTETRGTPKASTAIAGPPPKPSLSTAVVKSPVTPPKVPGPRTPPKAAGYSGSSSSSRVTPSVGPKQLARIAGSVAIEPPKAKAKLSSPVADLGKASVPVHVTSSVASTPGLNVIRVSLDYNGVCNVESAGSRELKDISWPVVEAITAFLKESPLHFLGICSWIGTSGPESQNRRRSLVNQVIKLNRFLVDEEGIPPEQCVRLTITSDRDKGILTPETVSCHLDDKLSVIQACASRKVPTCWFSRQDSLRHKSVQSIKDFFEWVRGRCVPHQFTSEFFTECR